MKISRRVFLKTLAAGAGGLLLVSCARETEDTAPQVPEGSSPAEQPKSVPASEAEPLNPPPALDVDAALEQPAVEAQPAAEQPAVEEQPAAEALTEPAQPSAGAPHLAVARGEDIEALVQRAIASLGGMSVFVPKEAWVIIKPNICVAYHGYEYAATTNPWVVGALVKLALEAGAKKVQVMDNPFGGTPDQAYKISGIREQVEAAGGEMVSMSIFKYKRTDIPDGLDIQSWDIYDDILQADVLIDVPIAKHHGLARLTLGMKNLMGVVNDRGGLHPNLGQRLADLTSRVRPALTVVDAVRILTANGPTGGSLDDVRLLNTVIASPDIVAADSYAATLFGLQPEEIAYIQKGAAMGLGRSDLQNLVIEEIAV
jgi:uncharacterized protein (DUF362 family)